ncbi:MAG: preprotein translocase subunit SecG [Candidatus Aminicenantes bacterium]|nr:preprotein translocase subunit SecG [Candidatus Aminicenantes bacterium]
MNTILITIHVLVCIILIIAVLLQSGKAADLAGAFGGAGSQTAFGPRGAATLLGKVTTFGAIIFMLTSMGLWILSAKGDKSVVSGEKEVPVVGETQQPATAPDEAPKEATAAETGDKQAVTPATEEPKSDAQKQQPEAKKKEPPKKETSPDIDR